MFPQSPSLKGNETRKGESVTETENWIALRAAARQEESSRRRGDQRESGTPEAGSAVRRIKKPPDAICRRRGAFKVFLRIKILQELYILRGRAFLALRDVETHTLALG